MIGVIDLNISNISSVINSLNYLKIPHLIIKKDQDFEKINKLILPGVGSFEAGIKNLKKNNFDKKIIASVKIKKKPLFGICLGMQLLMDKSDESPGIKGLSLIRGNCVKFSNNIVVPHIGWNNIKKEKDCKILKDIKDTNFYFLHSYYCNLKQKSCVSTTVNYGKKICSSISYKNIFAVQFHPEKSQEEGLKIIKNFSLI